MACCLDQRYAGIDLAIIQIPELAGQNQIAIARDMPAPSETVFALGFPVNFGFYVGPLLSVGRVFAPRRVGIRTLDSNVQTSNGSAGGPIVNINGELVGIAVLGSSSTYPMKTTAIGSPRIIQVLDSISGSTVTGK